MPKTVTTRHILAAAVFAALLAWAAHDERTPSTSVVVVRGVVAPSVSTAAWNPYLSEAAAFAWAGL